MCRCQYVYMFERPRHEGPSPQGHLRLATNFPGCRCDTAPGRRPRSGPASCGRGVFAGTARSSPRRGGRMPTIRIRSATALDVPAILELIRQLAEYEQLACLVAATEERLREALFGAKPAAEVLLADCEQEVVGLAVFFTTYSTFLARPGIYLEDLYVKPLRTWERCGIGVVAAVGRDRRRARLRKAGVGSAQLERAGHPLLREAGCSTPARMDQISVDGEGTGATRVRRPGHVGAASDRQQWLRKSGGQEARTSIGRDRREVLARAHGLRE